MPSDPEVTNANQTNTEGGAIVDGTVNTTGGNFVGRDQTISGDQVGRDKISGAGDIHIHNYPAPPPPTPTDDDIAPAPGESPYQGMAYYDVTDADRFFGREALTAALVDHLRQQPLLAVVGASGSGKSSLVRAGVMPALQGKTPLVDGKQPPTGSVRWAYHLITPTARPLESLAASLTRSSESVTATSTLIDDLGRDGRSLHLYARRLVSGDQRLVLLVDQFEELFTLCKHESEQGAFVNNLLAAATPDGVVTLVLTLRADFYHHCARFPALRTALEHQQKYIGAMTPDELCRAIEEPARAGQWDFQAGLVEQLLQDVGHEPGALPLLSHALLETWQRRRGRTLTLAGYRAAGGVQGAIAKTADDVFSRFTDEQKAIARIIFLRLTELGEGVQDTRRRVRPAELKLTHASANDVQQVLKTLADARLVTTDDDEIQVSHEALIRNWETLREWLDDDREGNRIQRRLTEAANQWVEFGKDANLLYRGVLLQQAQEWLQHTSNPPNKIETEFLQTSQAELEAGIMRAADLATERERNRQRELDGQRQRTRLLRNAVLVTGLLFVLAAFAASISFYLNNQLQYEIVETQRLADIAFSRQLAAQASEQLANNNFLTGALLAVQSGSQQTTVETLAALNKVVTHRGILLTQFHHAGFIWGAMWSKDEQRVLTWSEDNTVGVWDAAGGQRLTTLHHEGRVNGAVWSEDEQRILTWSVDNTVGVWDVSNSQRLTTLRHESWVNGAVWSEDEQRILTWSVDNTVGVWDAADGQRLTTLRHEDDVNGTVWSKDEQRILTWSKDSTVGVWDASNSQRLATLHHRGAVDGAVWSEDEQRILTWSDDTVRVWDATSGQRLITFHHETSVFGALWSRDEQRILTWRNGGIVGVWDATNGQRLANLVHEGNINGVSWSKDEQRILTWSRDNTVGVWNATSGQRLATLRHERGLFGVLGAVWSEDEQRILTWSDDNTVGIWDAASGQRLSTLRHESPVEGALWSEDEQRILTWSLDESVGVWDATSGQRPTTLHHEDNVFGTIWNRDEQRILTWSADNTVGMWDAASGQRLATFRHENNVNGAVWSKDEQRIITWSADNTVGMWDTASGQRLATFRHENFIWGAVWSEGEERILAWSEDNTVRVWDVTTGQPLITLRHESPLRGALWSEDEQRILTWGIDNTVDVLDVSNGQRLAAFRHEGWVNGAMWSGDEQRILTWSADNTVGVWDATNGQRLATLRHENNVNGAVWSEDEQRILTWSNDSTVGVWDTASGQRLATLRHENNVNGAVWSKSEQRILTWGADNAVGVWDASNGQRLITFHNKRSIRESMWSGNEQHILVLSGDYTVDIWDVTNGQRINTLRHENYVAGAVWSVDGQRILTWDWDGTARLWLADASLLAQVICELIPRNFTEAEWRAFIGAEPYQRTCPAHTHLIGAAKRAAVETGDLARVEALFTQAVAVAKNEDNLTLTLDPHGEAIRYTVPVLAARANAAALACQVDEAIALYQQVRELDAKFFPGDPQVIVPVLAEQNGCPKPEGGTNTDEPPSGQPPSPLPSPPVRPSATGTPGASSPMATPGR